MSLIKINNKIETEGKVSVARKKLLNTSTGEEYIQIEGIMSLNTYIEEIDTIETKYFSLLGVDVHTENFGSEELEYIYSFNVDAIAIGKVGE